MMACCAFETQDIDFIANRPFIFSLRDKLNVLFVGRISNLLLFKNKTSIIKRDLQCQ